MTNPRWTFLCVSEDERPVRQFRVSAGVLRYVPSLAAAVVTTLTALAVMIVLDGSARLQVLQLRGEKAVMSQEVESIRSRVGQMEASIDGFIENDEHFRLLAGLEPIDDEIFEVGVGGPGMAATDSRPMWETDRVTAEAVFVTSYDLSALERRASLLSESMAQAMESLVHNIAATQARPSLRPTTEGRVSSRFSQARLHPIYHEELPHVGIDLTAAIGTPIRASANGVVSYAGWKSGYGMTVEVDHGFGFMTRYAHANRILVERGLEVTRNDILALVGMTGTATASHLHYEVWVNGVATDPTDYILKGVIP